MQWYDEELWGQFHYIWLTIVMALSQLWFLVVLLLWRLSLADFVALSDQMVS